VRPPLFNDLAPLIALKPSIERDGVPLGHQDLSETQVLDSNYHRIRNVRPCAWHGLTNESSFRRARIIPEAVTLPDLSIAPMDQQLSSLIASNFPSATNSFGLSAVNAGGTLTIRSPNSPATLVRDDVLIPSCHLRFPI